MSVSGGEQIAKSLRGVMKKIPRQVAGAMQREAEAIMTLSKNSFVPVDDGTLRNSGFVEPPEVEADRVEITLGYGGAAADYAIIQHENIEFRHTVGEAKYLEKPVVQEAPQIPGRIAARFKF